MSVDHWLIDIERWIEREEKPFSIHSHKSTQKPQVPKSTIKRYYTESHNNVYLTSREFEISVLLVKNNGCKAIGQKLSLSPRTVEYYVQNLRLKFFCRDRKSLISILEKIEIVKHATKNSISDTND